MRVRCIKVGRLIAVVIVLCAAAGCDIARPTTSRPQSAPPSKARPTAITVRTFADIPRLLRLTWQGYERDFIQEDGRVVDHQRAGVTTSEGQSYALLRAAWMDDRPTFDRVWTWTRNNLQVRRDKLFSYLWGRRADGRWTILDPSSATDGDEDIALALLFAGRRWRAAGYQRQAALIAGDIWRDEVADVRGTPYLTAGSWAPSYTTPGPVIDPSYLAPYTYRLFARLDPTHPWSRLVASSYAVLTACSSAPLAASRSVGLPPNWCAIRRATGQVAPVPTIPRADAYGYDAFRTMWRIALDYLWNGEPRAKAYLAAATFLRGQWHRTGALTAYTHAGLTSGTPDVPLFYGGDLGAFVASDPAAAGAIVRRKLLPLFHQDARAAYWDQRYNYYEQNWIWYYEQNWIWFGLALADNRLPNLAA